MVVTPAIVDGKAKVGIELNDAKDAKYLRVGFVGAVTGSFHVFGTLFVDSFKALGVVPHEIGQLISHPSAKREAHDRQQRRPGHQRVRRRRDSPARPSRRTASPAASRP